MSTSAWVLLSAKTCCLTFPHLKEQSKLPPCHVEYCSLFLWEVQVKIMFSSDILVPPIDWSLGKCWPNFLHNFTNWMELPHLLLSFSSFWFFSQPWLSHTYTLVDSSLKVDSNLSFVFLISFFYILQGCTWSITSSISTNIKLIVCKHA